MLSETQISSPFPKGDTILKVLFKMQIFIKSLTREHFLLTDFQKMEEVLIIEKAGGESLSTVISDIFFIGYYEINVIYLVNYLKPMICVCSSWVAG